MCEYDSVSEAIEARPPEIAVGTDVWNLLEKIRQSRQYDADFGSAFANGRAFLESSDALRGRKVALIEWTGGRRLLGDDVPPIDLRVDHVYQISCKYLSANLANSSPTRLFDGLLTPGRRSSEDWYEATAPREYADLYTACRDAVRVDGLPRTPQELTRTSRQTLRRALGRRSYPPEAQEQYQRLCRAVSVESAQRWRDSLERSGTPIRMLWRLLRIGNAPYFVLGAERRDAVRLRVADPWDWTTRFELKDLDISPADAGQPRVDWTARYIVRNTGEDRVVTGHVEVRWSHGRFAQAPEAKVYIDTPIAQLPGYFALAGGIARSRSPRLFG
jgi:hypothetical protein